MHKGVTRNKQCHLSNVWVLSCLCLPWETWWQLLLCVLGRGTKTKELQNPEPLAIPSIWLCLWGFPQHGKRSSKAFGEGLGDLQWPVPEPA